MKHLFTISNAATTAILALIIWAIAQANSGAQNIIFRWLAALPYGDKIGHFLLFGCLAFCLSLALKRASFHVLNYKIYWGCAMVLSFALIEEASQHFLPTRTLDIWDVTADVAGILCAAALLKLSEHQSK